MKDLKTKAKELTKKRLWQSIIVCFITSSILTFGYKFNTQNKILNYKFNVTSNFKTKNNLNIIEKNLENNQIFKKMIDYKPTRGVLSVFFNQITGEGSIILGILNVNNIYLFRNSIPSLIIMLLGLLLSFLFYVFVLNIIIVGKNRFFLEKYSYENIDYDKIFFVYQIRKTKNVSFIMLKKAIYNILWFFTIIGGIIKHYEYSMIPYILAENPSISSKDCFMLSKKMVNNHKKQMFLLDLSLLKWYILGGITLGLSNIFYFNPYKESIYSCLYMSLRKETKSEFFKDLYLGKEGEVYPVDKYFLKEYKKLNFLKINYKIEYSLSNIILLFFSFSFIGWLWEVLLHLFNDGKFINRGTMFGPILPIYGWGGILILVLLKKYREDAFKLFINSFIISGIIEYFTALYLEVRKGMKWWDYSGYFLNINGRICLEGLLVFGLGGCVVTYFIAPLLNKIYNKIDRKIKFFVIIIFIVLYEIDLNYSSTHPNIGEGISKPIEITSNSYEFKKNIIF